MGFLQETLPDPFSAPERLARARYGVIAIDGGRLESITLRRWPKIISGVEASLLGRYHGRQPGDRCWVYYNQPRSCPDYLALKFVVSTRDCRFATLHRAAEVLDEVARIKRSHAILCDVWNLRISDRLLTRWGWQPHLPSRWHRHFIKRLYPTS